MANHERDGEFPVFEGYRILERVRTGPVTDLYLAEHLALGRPVLIKALGHGMLPSSPFAAALEREARLLIALDDPGVIRLFDFAKTERTMWLVLEHVDGWTLEDVLRKKLQISARAAAAIALQMAAALSHAHQHGIVHRDIQPRNVFVSREGVVKLANFAAAADERLPTAPELLDGSAGFGTPSYMSPEQLLGEPEDPRSDLFSLGIVLYEMIAGRRPFEAPDDRAASHRIRHDPVTALGRVVPNVPATLDRVVRRCLEKMPSDRFATALELARALQSEADGDDPRSAVKSELQRFGLVAAKVTSRRDGTRAAQRKRPPSVRSALVGYLVALALILIGGAVIQYGSATARGEGALTRRTRLELSPARAGYLRVVADPWANVFVDGELVDTTPFARSIALAAGVHYVRLEHPRAPVERRTVRLSAGETVLLDVKMDVARPRLPSQETSPSARTLTDPATP